MSCEFGGMKLEQVLMQTWHHLRRWRSNPALSSQWLVRCAGWSATQSCRRSSRSVYFLGVSISGVTHISGGMVSEYGGGGGGTSVNVAILQQNDPGYAKDKLMPALAPVPPLTCACAVLTILGPVICLEAGRRMLSYRLASECEA